MKKIYSKVTPGLLLHQIIKLEDINTGKTELSNPKEFLQIMALREDVKEYEAHKHQWKKGGKTITQESWIVIKGRVKGKYFDTDGNLIGEELLGPGDCSITFYGGHALQVLEKDTIFYEIKTGPYLGIEYDKATL